MDRCDDAPGLQETYFVCRRFHLSVVGFFSAGWWRWMAVLTLVAPYGGHSYCWQLFVFMSEMKRN